MNFKKLFLSGLLVSLCMVTNSQVYAAINTDVVYEVPDSSNGTSQDAAEEEMYKNQAYTILEKYFSIKKDALPKDKIFRVNILNKGSLTADRNDSLAKLKDALAQGKITQAQFDQQTAKANEIYDRRQQYVNTNNINEVTCSLRITDLQEPYYTESNYRITMNSNTKEVIEATVPWTTDGLKILQGFGSGKDGEAKVKAYKVSADTENARKKLCTDYIKKTGIAHIQNPQFVKIAGALKNEYIYKDAENDNKCVRIDFDLSESTKIVGILTDTQRLQNIIKK